MAKYKVKVSYGGMVSATAGEIVSYTNKSIISDLLKAGYIEEAKEAKEVKAGKKPAEPSKADKPTAKAKKENKED
ncbi:hypothetical protein SAMN02745671_02556 [Anaerovibrio lipolyticus DSM 3074]|uniref:Uncharacterized protein n=1 Tax=Anaerovibrio lipolyticus DSM 3074 TaxID=1120997 RepID=A0A1M6G7S0_9FIRM|nr:hypothetical protein [Anaerovibrio lipolyticus]SHJ05969.1 hypothetical protein SAMN02745671_02556 [Anaerovibrio lipolyticus DSM 3074]